MPILTPDELTDLRRQAARDEQPNWDKPTINTALQGVEDVLEAQGFDATAFVTITTTTNTRAQNVKDALDAGQIDANLVPVVEDWLLEHPPSITRRSVDEAGIVGFVTANRSAFAAATAGLPQAVRVKVVRLVVKRRVEAVV